MRGCGSMTACPLSADGLVSTAAQVFINLRLCFDRIVLQLLQLDQMRRHELDPPPQGLNTEEIRKGVTVLVTAPALVTRRSVSPKFG